MIPPTLSTTFTMTWKKKNKQKPQTQDYIGEIAFKYLFLILGGLFFS